MRVLWSSFVFVLTLIVGAIAFQAAASQFPGMIRDLIEWAQQLRPWIESQGFSNAYLLFPTGDKLVLLGFILMTRLVFALIGTIVGPLFGVGAGRADESAFQRWG
jgi:hypothetical protein